MNKEIKQLWLENLRNGKYAEMKQEYFLPPVTSSLTLRWKNYYNVFGVLCDMYAKYFDLKDCWKGNFDKTFPEWKSVEFMKSDWTVPNTVYVWAWMKRNTIHENHLWNMGFEEAAKYIEENL